MSKMICRTLFLLIFVVSNFQTVANDAKELRKERQTAQRERQAQKNQRSKGLNEAKKTFRDSTRLLKTEYQEKVKDLDTSFKIQEVELKAGHSTKIAEAEAKYRISLSGVFMNTGNNVDETALEKMQDEGKKHADSVFNLKKQSAQELHEARLENEKQKNALLLERDQLALEKAAELGLTRDYDPILAAPVGDGLTDQEVKWNEREKAEVVKIKGKNLKSLGEFRNGEKLREWQLNNLNKDFKLTWDEKTELHALESQQVFFNTMFMQSAKGEEVDQQAIMARLAENDKKRQLISIEYKKNRDVNRIKRQKEKKDLQNS